MLSIDSLLQVLVWGVVVGCIYALIASGFSLIFGVTKIINLAHGELIMISGYTTYWLSKWFQLNPYFIIPVSVLISLALNTGFYCLFFRVIGAEKIREAFLAIGLVYIIENTAVLLWKEDTRLILSPYRTQSIGLGSLNLGLDQLFIVILTITIFLVFSYLVSKSKIGKVLRAVSQNREAALMIGVNVIKIDILAFMLSGALAGIGGTLLGIVLYLNPYVGMNLSILAFIIVVFGGMGSIFGSIVAAIIFSVVQQITVFSWGGEWSNMVAFIILLIVMVLRPKGLFGKEVID
jgi:branched-chain amino acid transport system permease protein